MDVKTEFLNGDLEEEIYMNQPEGFIAPGQERIVCRLVNNDKMIKSTKDMLKSKFDMKDMGLADVILGIKIIRTHNELVLCQAHYVEKILNTHNARDFGLARTPIDTNIHLSKNRGVDVAQLEYSRIIGMFMYLMIGTRPDLAYVASMQNRYPAVIEGYNDANWISDIKDSRSTGGYVFTLGGPLYLGRVISIDYVKLNDNIAHLLMKGLSRDLVSKLSKGMGLKPLKE
ncbi:zinc finger, CCHC-type containing protein [Tanacetum coccineum]